MKTHLTEQDILSLTNSQKREEFLKTYEEWEVWDKSEALGLTVYRVILPNGDMITAAKYAAQSKYSPMARLNYLYNGCGFTPNSETSFRIADILKDTKQAILKKKKENAG